MKRPPKPSKAIAVAARVRPNPSPKRSANSRPHMQYLAWRSAREVVSYREGDLRCDFNCSYPSAEQPHVLYLHDRCYVSGQERRLTGDESVRIEERLSKFLTERRVFLVKLGTLELQVIR